MAPRNPLICARALREFISSELPRHHRTFMFASTSSLPRTLSHLLATSTHGLRRNHTCHSSPCQHKLFNGVLLTRSCGTITGTSTTRSRNCICGISIVLNYLDGLHSASQFHRHIDGSIDDTLDVAIHRAMIWTTVSSTISSTICGFLMTTICSTIRSGDFS